MNAITWTVHQMATAAPVAPAPRKTDEISPQKHLEIERMLRAGDLLVCDIAEICAVPYKAVETRKIKMHKAGRL